MSAALDPSQGVLAGFEADSTPCRFTPVHKRGRTLYGRDLFFAVMPSPADAASLHKRSMQIHARLGIPKAHMQAANRLHSTLLKLGRNLDADTDLPSQLQIDSIKSALSKLPMARLSIRFTSLRGYEQQALAWRTESLGQQAFLALRKDVAQLLRRAGLRPESNGPAHMTLHYGMPWSVGDHPIEDPIEWLPERLALILSHVGYTEHEELLAWKLR